MQIQSSYKVHLNTISNGELSDPVCDSVNRGRTLVRLVVFQPKYSLYEKSLYGALSGNLRAMLLL